MATIQGEENATANAAKQDRSSESGILKRMDRRAQRREMPWVKVEKNYLFDGPDGKVSLSDLFRSKAQLIVYHFMLASGGEQGCPGCSFLGDHFDGALV